MGAGWFRRLWHVRVAATTWVGLTRVGYFLLFVVPSQALEFQFTEQERLRLFVLTLLYAAVMSPAAYLRAKREFAPVAEWIDSGRPPTAADRAELLAVSWRQAVGTAGYWSIGGLVGAAYYALVHEADPLAMLALFVGATLLGLHAAAFVHLLVERFVQPLAAQVVSGADRVHLQIVSVRNRLLLAFALGPGVSLAGVGIFLLLRAPGRPEADLGQAIWPIVVLAFFEGCVLVYGAARSVTEPINEIREAMKRVSEGDLTADVAVDATSEVGLLQNGFNEMLEGLRERHRLRQLLGEYAGDDVAANLLQRGADFEGTTVDASVVMVDLIGSTPLAEANPSRDVLAVLNSMFDVVVRVTRDEGGWVNRFVGDAAVCVFGAPTSQDDHADRALRAARALRAELAALQRELPWLDAGIGVSSGQLLAGDVGSSARHEFTVIGDAANEAARLTDQAKHRPGRLLVSGTAIDRAGAETASWRPVGSVLLRGRSRETALFEPVDAIETVEASDSVQAVGAGPLRGRPTG